MQKNFQSKIEEFIGEDGILNKWINANVYNAGTNKLAWRKACWYEKQMKSMLSRASDAFWQINVDGLPNHNGTWPGDGEKNCPDTDSETDYEDNEIVYDPKLEIGHPMFDPKKTWLDVESGVAYIEYIRKKFTNYSYELEKFIRYATIMSTDDFDPPRRTIISIKNYKIKTEFYGCHEYNVKVYKCFEPEKKTPVFLRVSKAILRKIQSRNGTFNRKHRRKYENEEKSQLEKKRHLKEQSTLIVHEFVFEEILKDLDIDVPVSNFIRLLKRICKGFDFTGADPPHFDVATTSESDSDEDEDEDEDEDDEENEESGKEDAVDIEGQSEDEDGNTDTESVSEESDSDN